MTTTQISLSVVAIMLTTAAMFGSYKYASAHTNNHSWRGNMLHTLHTITDEDWNNPEKISQYKKMCVQRSIEGIETFINHLESELKLSDEQSGPWSQLVTTFKNEKSTLEFVCEKILIRANTENLPARLELFSTIVATGQETLQRISPAITDFYEILGEKQKADVDAMFAKLHKKHGMMLH